MIDLVYILGKGSTWDDNELRYSLRSVEKHLHNVGDVWIVGEWPRWITNANHLTYADAREGTNNNIARKIIHACKNIPDEFILMSDDYYLLQDFDTETFPFYHHGLLVSSSFKLRVGHAYRTALENTTQMLLANGFHTINYNVHGPMHINSSRMLKVLDMYGFDKKQGVVAKSLYGNIGQIQGGVFIDDVKIREKLTYQEIKMFIAGKPFFSTGNSSLNSGMRQMLKDLYPTKSKFEL